MADKPDNAWRIRDFWNLKDLRLTHTVGTLGHYRNIRAADMLSEHHHGPMMEICYLRQGSQVYRVGGRDYLLRPGDIFVTYPGESHSTGGNPQERGELYWIQISLRGRGRFLNLSPREALPLLMQLRHLPRRHYPAGPRIEELFTQLEACAHPGSSPTRRLQFCSLLVQLLLEMIASASCRQAPSQSPDLNRVIQYIARNIRRPLDIQELADVQGLSLSWFKARFRQEMGIPPAEYVLRAKLELARQLLLAGKSITEVAYELGFSSSQYFATVFRRFTGRRPSQWQQDSRQARTAARPN